MQLPILPSVKEERSGAHLGLPLRWTWGCVRTHSWFEFRRTKSWLWFCLLFHQGTAKFVVSWIFWQPLLKCFSTLLSSWMKGAFCKKQDNCYSPLRLHRNSTVPWQSDKQHSRNRTGLLREESVVRCCSPSAIRILSYAPQSKTHSLLKSHYSVTFILA